MNRKEIADAIATKVQAIKLLKKEIDELSKEDLLLCDETQWFVEKIEPVKYKEGRKKVTKNMLIGRIYWNETFTDEGDPNNSVTIERCKTVRVDGVWI